MTINVLTAQTIADGSVLDMYVYQPGLRTVTVTFADNIGNAATGTCQFTIQATPDSLINGLIRAKSEGDVPNQDVYDGLMDKLNQVKKQHDKGKHSVDEMAETLAFVAHWTGLVPGDG